MFKIKNKKTGEIREVFHVGQVIENSELYVTMMTYDFQYKEWEMVNPTDWEPVNETEEKVGQK